MVRLAVSVALLVTCGCGEVASPSSPDASSPDATTEVSLVSITLSPDVATVTAGESQQFAASAAYSDGSDGDVTATATWTTSDPTIAAENPGQAGLILTAGVGAVTITATLDGVSGDAALTVDPPPLGSHPGNPGESCLDIRDAGASIGDGLYWIDPADTGAFQVRCDMTTDGGGWTITYDVDAEHFDGIYLNNFTASAAPPLATNAQSDIWNAEAVMTFTETLWGCGQQDNLATFYWRYAVTDPHTWMANTTTDYYTVALSSAASNAGQANCGGVSKNTGSGYGWVVLETGTACGSCQNMLFGMYHYTSTTGCNSTSTIYGDHASPWNGRSITYPICNLQQTSNGRFWMAVR